MTEHLDQEFDDKRPIGSEYKELDDLVKAGRWWLIEDDRFPEIDQYSLSRGRIDARVNDLYSLNRLRREFPAESHLISILMGEVFTNVQDEIKNLKLDRKAQPLPHWFMVTPQEEKGIGMAISFGFPSLINPDTFPSLMALSKRELRGLIYDSYDAAIDMASKRLERRRPREKMSVGSTVAKDVTTRRLEEELEQLKVEQNALFDLESDIGM